MLKERVFDSSAKNLLQEVFCNSQKSDQWSRASRILKTQGANPNKVPAVPTKNSLLLSLSEKYVESKTGFGHMQLSPSLFNTLTHFTVSLLRLY